MRTVHTTITPQGQKRGLSNSSLKLIAMVCMLIDHTAVVLLEQGYFADIIAQATDIDAMHAAISAMPHGEQLFALYSGMRLVGRMAFPIFCFLLAEGFTHTRNPLRYLLSLGVFALISEIPFDLATSGTYVDLSSQNVFFTLFFGALALYGIEYANGKEWPKVTYLFAFLIPALAAFLLKTDYGIYGVAFIVILYMMRTDRQNQTLSGVILGFFQVTAALAFLPIWFYNGKRGLSLKWAFYLFYPLHLLALHAIRVQMF